MARVGGKSGTDECPIQIHLDVHQLGMKRKRGRVNGLTIAVFYFCRLVDGIPIIIQFSRVLSWERGEKVKRT